MNTALTSPLIDNHVTEDLSTEVPNEQDKQPVIVVIKSKEDDTGVESFHGYKSPIWKSIFFWAFGILSGGTAFLLAKWYRNVYARLKLVSCSLSDATSIRVQLKDGRVDLVPVVTVEKARGSEDGKPGHEVLLVHRCRRYLLNPSGTDFVPVPELPQNFGCHLTTLCFKLCTSVPDAQLATPGWDAEDLRLRYGLNEMHIPVKSLLATIGDEMWHPFYVFQYISIGIWTLGDPYYSYSACIAFITWVSIISSALESHRNATRLASVAACVVDVTVLRHGSRLTLPGSELLPGDVVVLGEGQVPADMVLVRGEAIVDENMLTGESVPVRKVPVTPGACSSYNPDLVPAITLYAGTRVAQARGKGSRPALAVVVRSGFGSAKGQLLRSILYPVNHEAPFITDTLRFILIMLAICMGLYSWAAVILAHVGASPKRIIIRFLDMICIAVPPALPACLTVATVFSTARLKRRGLFVTAPDRIALAGQMDVACLDKTGTLTHQGLDLEGIVPVRNGSAGSLTADMSLLPHDTVALLACCHGLACLDGKLVGDPMDARLFEATAWELLDERGEEMEMDNEAVALEQSENRWFHKSSSRNEENSEDRLDSPHEPPAEPSSSQMYVRPHAAGPTYRIAKRYEFSSALQRNVVVVVPPGGGLSVFAKGSPEVVRSMVDPRSIPHDFDEVLAGYTREGLRVLALAAGHLVGETEGAAAHWSQMEAEQVVNLELLGLAVMANHLRACTAPAIAALAAARVRPVMVTGDHLRTSVSIAHKCGIMPSGVPLCVIDAAAPPNKDTGTLPSRVSAPDLLAFDSPPSVDEDITVISSISSSWQPSSGLFTSPSSATLVEKRTTVAMPMRLSGARMHGSEPGFRLPDPAIKLTILDGEGNTHGSCTLRDALPYIRGGILELAVTGAGFSALLAHHDVSALEVCLRRARVWARMSPDHKRLLVEMLGDGPAEWAWQWPCPSLGLCVGFCGDGANDCGALKAAHVGISLCEAEASVAAPMTSTHQSVHSVVTVVAEGRCSLVATYQIFQFIIGYALVQAFETNLMYTFSLNVGSYQYLIQDLFFTTLLAALMGATGPRSELAPVKPERRVLSAPLLISTVAQLIVVAAFQIGSLRWLASLPGYTPTQGLPDLQQAKGAENTVTYILALSQFITLALVFNRGWPHRKPMGANLHLVAALLLQAAWVVFTLAVPNTFLNSEIQDLEGDDGVLGQWARIQLGILMIANMLAAFIAEALAQVTINTCFRRSKKSSKEDDLTDAPLLLCTMS